MALKRTVYFSSVALVGLMTLTSSYAEPDDFKENSKRQRQPIVQDVWIDGKTKSATNFQSIINLPQGKKRQQNVKTLVVDGAFNPYVENLEDFLTQTYFSDAPLRGSREQLKAETAAKTHHHANHVTDTLTQVAQFGKVRVFDYKNDPKLQGLTNTADIIDAAVDQAIDSHASFMSLSLSFSGEQGISEGVKKALLKAKRAGIVVFKSAGNDGEIIGSTVKSQNLAKLLKEMDGYMYVVGNTAYNKNGEETLHQQSNAAGSASQYYICAPGTEIKAKDANGQDMLATGTSMANPVASGAAQFLMSSVRNLTNKEAAKYLAETARKQSLDDRKLDPLVYGHGVIDVSAALKHAEEETKKKEAARLAEIKRKEREASLSYKLSQAASSIGSTIKNAVTSIPVVGPVIQKAGSAIVSGFSRVKSWFGF